MDISTNAHVAIKKIKKSNKAPYLIVQQRNEFEILKLCQHQNIIKFIEFFETDQDYFVVMEKIAG